MKLPFRHSWLDSSVIPGLTGNLGALAWETGSGLDERVGKGKNTRQGGRNGMGQWSEKGLEAGGKIESWGGRRLFGIKSLPLIV